MVELITSPQHLAERGHVLFTVSAAMAEAEREPSMSGRQVAGKTVRTAITPRDDGRTPQFASQLAW